MLAKDIKAKRKNRNAYMREYMRKYNLNPESHIKILKSKKKFRDNNKGKIQVDNAEYSKNHRKLLTAINRRYEHNLKIEVLSHYCKGNICCEMCGKSDIIQLSIDHINGKGGQHRREINNPGGGDFYRWLKENNYPTGYRVLCMNCNKYPYFTKGLSPSKPVPFKQFLSLFVGNSKGGERCLR